MLAGRCCVTASSEASPPTLSPTHPLTILLSPRVRSFVYSASSSIVLEVSPRPCACVCSESLLPSSFPLLPSRVTRSAATSHLPSSLFHMPFSLIGPPPLSPPPPSALVDLQSVFVVVVQQQRGALFSL